MLAAMYIRRTTTRSNSDGQSYFSYRLVESVRVADKVKQRTLLNLGRHFDIERSHWPELCSRVEQLLTGQMELVGSVLDQKTEQQAQHIYARLISAQAQPGSQKSNNLQNMQSVDIDSLDMVQPRSVGVEHLSLWAIKQLELDKMFDSFGFNGRQKAAAIGLIVGRMTAPGSELATYRWLQNHSALGELLDFDFGRMSHQQLYRASDLLFRKRATIEQNLFARVRRIFDLEETVTLYDLTNTYFEGGAAGQRKAQRGHSKEKRTDCPLLTLGLMLDGSGFVRRSRIFAGNVFEGHTLQNMLLDLKAPQGALVVLDRGIATEKNLAWMREAGFRYLVVSRGRDRDFDFAGAQCIETASKQQIFLQKVNSDDGKETRLYCRSQQRAEKEKAISERFSQKFEQALDDMSQKLSRPRTSKKVEKIWERIGRLKAKSRGIGQHYEIEVDVDKSKKLATKIRWKRKPVTGRMLTHPGVYTLRSNELNWDAERMWRTYVRLTDLEAVFRSLKSELGLRPIYHHSEERSDGHLFITVIAYQAVQLIRRKLREHDIHDSWQSIRQSMSRQQRVTAIFKRSDGKSLHVRKSTRPEAEQKRIYQALKINDRPGKISQLIV